MTKPFAISILIHGGLVGLLLGVPSDVSPPRKTAVSLVTVNIVAKKPIEPVEPAMVETLDRPDIKKSRGTKNERRRTRDERRTTNDEGRTTRDEKGPETAGPKGTIALATREGSEGTVLDPAGGIGAGAGVATPEQLGTGSGGDGEGQGTARGSAEKFSSAYAAIREAIERAAQKSYPLRARKLGIQGVVTVRFVVGPDGAATDVVVTAGSGHEILDQAARSIVAGAGPYPAVPEPVQIPIRFSLDPT
jgi:protein TonB